MSDALPGSSTALRRCPGCRNRVTTRTPLCPVCGRHAVAARMATLGRWLVIVAAAAAVLAWWQLHRG